MPEDQINRLREFAAKHGDNWKDKLRALWLSGKDASEPGGYLLRQVRNTLGPSGIERLELDG